MGSGEKEGKGPGKRVVNIKTKLKKNPKYFLRIYFPLMNEILNIINI